MGSARRGQRSSGRAGIPAGATTGLSSNQREGLRLRADARRVAVLTARGPRAWMNPGYRFANRRAQASRDACRGRAGRTMED